MLEADWRRKAQSASAAVVVTMCCNELGDDLYNPARPFYASQSAKPNVMKELLALFAQIAVSRKGPQDLPASWLLLVLTVAGYGIIRFLVSSVMPPVFSTHSPGMGFTRHSVAPPSRRRSPMPL